MPPVFQAPHLVHSADPFPPLPPLVPPQKAQAMEVADEIQELAWINLGDQLPHGTAWRPVEAWRALLVGGAVRGGCPGAASRRRSTSRVMQMQMQALGCWQFL